MTRYLLNRMGGGLLVIAGVVCVVFLLFNVLPADPARMMLGQRADSVSVALINRDLGRDLPRHIQFAGFINDLSPISVFSTKPESRLFADTVKYGNMYRLFSWGSRQVVLKEPYLRRSYQSKKFVSDILFEKLPDTVVLAIASLAFAVLAGVSLGIVAALKKGSTVDRAIMALSLSGISLPSFFASILFAWLFGFVLSRYTGLNMTGGLYEVNAFRGAYIEWKNLLLPALVLGFRPLAIIVQLTRSSLLDVLSQDYIRTARAKGLNAGTIITRHAMANAMNPVITSVSGWLGSLLAGAVFIEFIFGWNGIGKLTVTALENYDLPVVTGVVLFISIVFIVLNILADLLNSALDPRIRTGTSQLAK